MGCIQPTGTNCLITEYEQNEEGKITQKGGDPPFENFFNVKIQETGNLNSPLTNTKINCCSTVGVEQPSFTSGTKTEVVQKRRNNRRPSDNSKLLVSFERIPPKILTLKFYSDQEESEDILMIKINQNILTKPNGDKIIRTKKENEFFFSFGKKLEEQSKVDVEINDDKIAAVQFKVSYEIFGRDYCIEDVKEGTGIYLKVQNSRKIPLGGLVIFFCDVFVKLTVNEKEKKILQVVFYNDKFANINFTFNGEEKQKITCGRVKDADFSIKKVEMSRIQWTIVWDIDSWKIFDGSIDDEKQHPSTNGVWELIDKKIILEDGMRFKTAKTLIDVGLK